MPEVTVVLHDVSSSNRLVDFAKAVQNYKETIKLVIFSRVTGGAAQYGLADASKILFKDDIPFLYVSDLRDLSELGLLKNHIIIQFSRSFGTPFKTFKDIMPGDTERRVMFLFSGSETGFSRSEILDNANVLYADGLKKDVTPEAYLVLAMHLLLYKI